MITMLVLGAVGTLLCPQDPEPRPCLDRTGIRWVLPFDKAREEARQAKRLLLIKPIAFGTSPDGGW